MAFVTKRGNFALDGGQVSWEFLAFLDMSDRFLSKSCIFSGRCAKFLGIYAIFTDARDILIGSHKILGNLDTFQ